MAFPLPLDAATSNVLIVVFASYVDAETGRIASYTRQGSNIADTESLAPEIGVKRLEPLCETLQATGTVAVIRNPRDQGNALHKR